MRLRYVGSVPVTFSTGNIGRIDPGSEFTVPDEISSSFIGRGDVEVSPPGKPLTPSPKTSKPPKAPPPTPGDTASGSSAEKQEG